MNKIYLLFVCCFMSLAASAVVTTYPLAISAPYGGVGPSGICQNSANTATTVTYSVCGTTTAGSALSVTATWYLNGTLVYTDPTSHTIAAGGGTITLPAGVFTYSSYGSFTGANGLYCVLSWSALAPSPCTGNSSDTSAATGITVNQSPAAITGTATSCTGASSTLSNSVAGGVWSSSNSGVASVGFSTGTVTGVAAGTARISYTLPSGCSVNTIYTVNQTPAAITGTFNVCTATLTTMHDVTAGGTWSSSTPAVGTIGVATGGFNALTTGVTTITYTMASGCMATTNVTVNQSPTVITGPSVVCSGSTISMTDGVGGGVWTSSAAAVASVNFSTGVVTAVGASGTARISYTLSSGCTTNVQITVNPIPAAISGTASVCVGSLTSLSDITAGGNWSASNSNVSVGTGSGFVISGVTAGLDTIYYTLSTGCNRSVVVTVNPLPAAISGSNVVCAGSTTPLTDAVAGGTWSSSVISVATIATSGVVTGVAAGVTIITYKLNTGCYITIPLTVNPLPAGITGAASICVGFTTTLSDVTTGGVWSSNNTSVALIGSSSGIAAGSTPGTAVISYTLPTGCAKSIVLTVNATPAAISGATSVCIGTSTILSDVTAGGTWSSTTTAVATINAAGKVSGVSAGTTTISYKVSTGCATQLVVTVNTNPNPISGTVKVCLGSTTSLSDASTGGTWSSSNTGVGTVSPLGDVTGIATGTTTITYTIITGCMITAAVTVNPLPFAVSGAGSVCTGSTITLSDLTSGGTWSSTNTALATVTGGGVVTGILSGTDTVNYTISTTGCVSSKQVIINAVPSPISGTPAVCVGSVTSLSDATPGGTWSSSNTKATVDGSGNVTGVTAGVATISYVLGTGCQTTIVVTVDALPGSINGLSSVCNGASITLSDATPGGSWGTTDITIATVSGTGVVTGTGIGSVSIIYTLGTGCATSTTISVNPLPAPIDGTEVVCVGLTTTLTDAVPGGVWSSGTTTVATIGFSTGTVTGMTAGTSNITYTLTSGCRVTAFVTVYALPAAISGPTSLCNGATITLTDATAGGLWTSADDAIASIGSGSGIVISNSSGTVTISYTLSTGCYRTRVINVNALPVGVVGASSICSGSTTVLTDPTAGGSWTSGTTSVATVGLSTGVVTGVSAGSTIITYTLSTGCDTTFTMTVNPIPVAISGPPSVCQGLQITLGDASFPGTWTSGNVAVATIDTNSGVLTGVAAGTVSITFTLGTGCYKTTTITVHQLPTTITGNLSMCSGIPSGLADLTPGGSWSSSNPGVASINSAGLVTPGPAGTATITYTLSSTGCYNTTTVTVNTTPSAIAGPTSVCAGFSVTLSDATAGGTWVSSNSIVATVVDTTGVVTGVTSGPAVITYILSTGCSASVSFSVNPLPAPITGTTYLCVGTTTLLHDATAGGGTWSSDNITVATVSGGSVLGINAGTANISYIPATGCIATTEVTVNSVPTPIMGSLNVCTGLTDTLHDTTAGGEWISGNSAIAATGTLTGIITGVSAGNTTISYILGTGCFALAELSVTPTPAAITGPSNVCEGFTISLSDATSGGIWSSSDPAVASVGAATGIVLAQNIAGPDTIFYTTGGLCSVYKIITINQTPDTIRGITNVCTGLSDTLTNDVGGGTWTSSNTAIATVGLTTGIVSGVTGGTVYISYILGTGCYAYTADTVNTTPGPIMGPSNVCPGLSITLSDATPLGTWSSSAPTIANVGGVSGIVTGVAISGGTATISYIVGSTGCGVATTINVNPEPPAILGSLDACVGFTNTLSDVAPGGIWISSNPSVATIGVSSGVVSGFSAGTTIITYELLSSGCQNTSILTVNPVPGPILGMTSVCVNTTITLSDTTILGTWSSSDTSVAKVGSITGIVTGVDSGYATITYTVASGCYSTYLIRVNMNPSPIIGANNVCPGLIITMSDVTSFGTWSSSDTTVIAVIDAFTGNVTGVVPGTTTITYMLGTGCYATQQVTVNPLPSPIIGSAIICVDATLFMSDATSGGVWSSTNTALGTIDGAGNLTGISPGYDTINYTLPTGCFVSHYITVSAGSSAITGDSVVCVGSIDTLSASPAGGVWSSSNITIATVGSSTGYVTGVSASFVIITYTTLAGCKAEKEVTVKPVPGPITGINNLCPGLTTTLFDVTGGGIWSSTNASVASIGTDGTVTSIMQGQTTTISYTMANGCAATFGFTVNPTPYVGTITGNKIFCMTTTSALGDSVAGGVWSSSNSTVASIGSASGVATGVSVGTATISYIVTEQCGKDTATTIVQIKPLPYAGPILGSPQMCIHSYTTLADSIAGGIWTSHDTAIANVDSVTGVVYGANPGTTTISYTYTNSCGSYTTSILVTVNATFGFAHIVTKPDSGMCANTRFQNFGALLPEPTGIQYNWSVTPGDTLVAVGANGQYAIVTFHNSGRAVVTLSAEVLSSGCSITDSFVTTIGSGVSSNPDVQYYLTEFVCTDNTQDSYQWGYDDIITLDSTLLTGETNQSYYNPSPDTLRKNYWVITTKNGCSQKSYYTFNTITRVNTIADNNFEVLLFPNPADSRVNIEVKGLKGTGEIEVKLMDMFGKDIQAATLINGKGSLDVANLPSGVYSALILNNGVKIGSKVFVKN